MRRAALYQVSGSPPPRHDRPRDHLRGRPRGHRQRRPRGAPQAPAHTGNSHVTRRQHARERGARAPTCSRTASRKSRVLAGFTTYSTVPNMLKNSCRGTTRPGCARSDIAIACPAQKHTHTRTHRNARRRRLLRDAPHIHLRRRCSSRCCNDRVPCRPPQRRTV
jgi:hypothetical protein